MAELVDAPASGAGARKGVEVRVLFWAPVFQKPLKTLGDRPKDGPLSVSATIPCYDLVQVLSLETLGKLREMACVAVTGLRGCYGFTPENLPKGMCRRGGQFYYRRNVPKDVQRLISRTEIWRSLKTDSLKLAARRLPGVAAQIEAFIERARLDAGLTVDETLLKPFTDDLPSRSGNAVNQIRRGSEHLAENPPASAPVTLGEAYERYLTDPPHSWSARTREAFETSRRMAVAVIGADSHCMRTPASLAFWRSVWSLPGGSCVWNDRQSA